MILWVDERGFFGHIFFNDFIVPNIGDSSSKAEYLCSVSKMNVCILEIKFHYLMNLNRNQSIKQMLPRWGVEETFLSVCPTRICSGRCILFFLIWMTEPLSLVPKTNMQRKNLLQLQFNPSIGVIKKIMLILRLFSPGNQMQLGAFKEAGDEHTD